MKMISLLYQLRIAFLSALENSECAGVWLLRVLLYNTPDIWTPIVWGQFLFGCIIKSTYSGGLPKLKSLDLGACTVPWDANQVLGLK